jgi:uncharacterized cupin superfamily protein
VLAAARPRLPSPFSWHPFAWDDDAPEQRYAEAMSTTGTVNALSHPHPQALSPDLAISAEGEAVLEGYSSENGAFTTGTWTHPRGIFPAEFNYDEVCVLLEGHVRLTSETGFTAEFKAGETFVIPKGFKGTWETLEPVRKHYIIFDRSQLNG